VINYKILLKIFNLIIINHVNSTCKLRFSHVKLYFLNRGANYGLTPLHYTHHGLTPLPPHHTTGSLHHTTTVAPRLHRGAVTLSPTLLLVLSSGLLMKTSNAGFKGTVDI
jgi:hypothetical protein